MYSSVIYVTYAGDLKHIWKCVTKIIDSLHISNHVDPRCKKKYDPQPIKEKHPEFNTIACEQTFAWMSRHKKIVCFMPKTHHHFYVHRMVKDKMHTFLTATCMDLDQYMQKSPELSNILSNAALFTAELLN